MTTPGEERIKRAVNVGATVGAAFALIALIRGSVALVAAVAAGELSTLGSLLPIVSLVALNFALFGGSTFLLVATGAVWRSPEDGDFQASPWFFVVVVGGLLVFFGALFINKESLGMGSWDGAVRWLEGWGALVVIGWVAARGWRRGDA
jgi:Ca2+/Na+ antiporter